MSSLTPKQLRFCHFYLELGCNATKAYLASGYKVKSEVEARACASRLLTKANVKVYLERQQKELRENSTIKSEEVVQALARIAFSGLSEALEIDESGTLRFQKNGDLRNVEQVVIRDVKGNNSSSYFICVKSLDCLRALDLLCKIFGLYDNKGNDEKKLVIENASRVLMQLKKMRDS